MPRKKRSCSPFDLYDDDYDEDTSSHSSRNDHPPIQRNAANARERMRMRVLSSAYGRLKTKLPNIPPDTKLSKLDTLRLATLYIKQLIAAVENGTTVSGSDSATDTNQPGVQQFAAGMASAFNFHHGGPSMSWPFEFSQHLQHNSNQQRHFQTQETRLDWTTHAAEQQTFGIKQQQTAHRQEQHSSSGSYTSMSSDHEMHWYSSQEAVNSCVFDMQNHQNHHQHQKHHQHQQHHHQQQQQQQHQQQQHHLQAHALQ